MILVMQPGVWYNKKNMKKSPLFLMKRRNFPNYA